MSMLCQFHQHVYVQLLRTQIPKAQKVAWVDCLFALLGSACLKSARKMLMKCWWNWPPPVSSSLKLEIITCDARYDQLLVNLYCLISFVPLELQVTVYKWRHILILEDCLTVHYKPKNIWIWQGEANLCYDGLSLTKTLLLKLWCF